MWPRLDKCWWLTDVVLIAYGCYTVLRTTTGAGSPDLVDLALGMVLVGVSGFALGQGIEERRAEYCEDCTCD